MPWKAIALTAAEISGGVEGELQDAFLAVLTAAGLPKDAVLYTGKSYNPYGFSLYFSPKAAEITGDFLNGYPLADCLPPDLDEVAVLVKNE